MNMNDFEKALVWLQAYEISGSTQVASRLTRDVCGTLHENVGEWVEWLTRNNPEFWENC
jgi:hypothetical protein